MKKTASPSAHALLVPRITQTAAYVLSMPERRRRAIPLLLSSPHSGRNYPQGFLEASILSPRQLRHSEDAFMDLILQSMVEKTGATLLSANFPRSYVDVNREPWELDPSMFCDPLPDYVTKESPRIKAGLGTIPKNVTSALEIYEKPLPFSEAQKRIEDFYKPYHQALQDNLKRLKSQFGYCLLLDCHSMPSLAQAALPKGGPKDGKHRALPSIDVVLGDRFGLSCHESLTSIAGDAIKKSGFSVYHNTPYAGGFITERYGSPKEKTHCLQIEISRHLYMDEGAIQCHGGLERIQRLFLNIILSLAEIQEEDL